MKLFRRVLVAIDGSSSSEWALDKAIAIAVDQQAEIHFVHVIERTPAQPAFGDAESAMHAAGDALLDHAVELACEHDLLGDGEILVTNDKHRTVAQQILCAASAQAADLIVYGAHGTGVHTALPLGSVAEELACCSRMALMPVHEHQTVPRDVAA